MTAEEWLGKDTQIGFDIWNRKYRWNYESFEEWLDRVSGGDKELRKLIRDRKFLFGGRVLANRGTNTDGSLFNCYSIGYVDDDYSKIMDAAKDIGLTFKAQGGQGLSLSKLRPKGTPIGQSYQSDGIVPFMKLFNEVTDATSQGGSRKGALMISLDVWHAEALGFITVKSGQGVIEKANLSLEVDDRFMQHVRDSILKGTDTIITERRDYNGHKVEYDVDVMKVFRALVQNAYDWGDPACLFTGQLRNYNLMEFDEGYQVDTVNPCGGMFAA